MGKKRGSKKMVSNNTAHATLCNKEQKDMSTVVDCYSTTTRGTDENRTASNIYADRVCNNFVKAALFSTHVPRHLPVRVFDWACGKGGDFFKLMSFFPSMERYVGMDITPKSIADFHERTRDKRTPVNFHIQATDLMREDLSGFRDFYVVTCQFAFHYFCATPSDMLETLTKMSSLLASGGKIILTIPDAREIQRRLRPRADGRLEMRIIDPESHALKCRIVAIPGNREYFFELLDAPGQHAVRAPEFFVDPVEFDGAVREAGLVQVCNENMLDFLRTQRVSNSILAESFKLPKEEECDASITSLYRVVVLEKSAVINLFFF
jgi:ubiquinone/menaquinone biosynthesis C-methylase UbiE